MEIPAGFRICDTNHWLVDHRIVSALPGYLTVGSKSAARNVTGLPVEAPAALGPLLARAQGSLQTLLWEDMRRRHP